MRLRLIILLMSLSATAMGAALIFRGYEISTGLTAYHQKNYSLAFAKLSTLGGWRDPLAEAELGVMYLRGLGTHQDFGRGVELTTASANSGCARGQYNLGKLYFNGEGVKQDKELANHWLQKAVDQGSAEAEAALGLNLLNGDGIAEDSARAKFLLDEAATQGEPYGAFGLGVIYETGHGVPQNYNAAREWYEKAAAKDISEGVFDLGRIYEDGKGVEANPAKAADLYSRATVLGLGQAAGALGSLYYEGSGVAKNTVVAYMLANIGAAIGCPDCEKLRDTILQELTPDQIAEGQALASGWTPGSPLKTATSLEAIAPQILFGTNKSLPNVSKSSRIYFSRNFTLTDTRRYVVFVVTNGDPCHGCGAKLSAVTFDGADAQNPWGHASRDFTEIGSWGRAPSLDDPKAAFSSPKRITSDFLIFNDKKAFVLVKDGASGQGETLTGVHVLVYYPEPMGWLDVGYIFTGDENSGDCYASKTNNPDGYSGICFSWRGTVQMMSGQGQDWPKFIVHRKGSIRNKNGGLEPVSDIRYKFNGSKYAEFTG